MPKFSAPLVLPVRTSDPSSTDVASMYYNSSTGVIRARGNSGWQNANTLTTSYSGAVGMVSMWIGGATPPSGWLICDGSAVNTYTYQTLHGLISNNFGGTAYSAGVTDQPDAVTTFNLPDYRGRMLVGASSALTGAASNTASTWFTGATSPLSAFSHSTDGSHNTHTLTQTSAGSHSHADTHSHTAYTGSLSTSVTMPNHTASGTFNSAGAAHTHSQASAGPSATGNAFGGGGTAVASDVHTHTITLASGGAGSDHVVGSTSYTATPGSGGSHSHTAGSTSTNSVDIGASTLSGHTHTVSAQGTGGSHAHTDHAPQIQAVHFIVRV